MSPLLLALLFLAGICFVGATFLYYTYLRTHRNDTGFWASVFTVIGWMALTGGGLIRTAFLGHLPLGSFSESLLLFLWLLATAYLVVEYRWQIKAGGAFVLPAVTAGVVYASAHPSHTHMILPILRSPWVAVHVGLVFLGYCTFALAGLSGVLYLVQERELKSKRLTFMHFSLPSLSKLEQLSSSLVGWGYPCLTLGIVAGAIWSRRVWHTYFPLDPKMVWAVMTWVFYTGCLAGRRVWGWRGRRVAILTVVGFLAVILNYFGISFILQGVHRF